ncbi:EAL domain-containing protein [Legionella sp. CNM-4043-24]|uniref:EAL domain-containing protein n=1 Tax=Legionella sp. CNM-4043-24 TaxID=3421646 RepID=UPI00403B146A
MEGIKQIRLLLIDDNEAIHKDFRKVLLEENSDDTFESLKSRLFSNDNTATAQPRNSMPYRIDSALQGKEGFMMVRQAMMDQDPYSLAFVDIRMPPGWDGIETIQRLWELDPELEVVICSAYSDYSFNDIRTKLQQNDRYLILKKPFDNLEIRQIAAALTKKWILSQQTQKHLLQLDEIIQQRTQELTASVSVCKATIEATQEGILGVDLKHKINVYNNNLLAIWELSEDVVKTHDAPLVFQKMAEMTDDPWLFLNQINNHDKAGHRLKREWSLKSGKKLELFIHAQYIEDRIAGYVFSFHDVTVNKALEAELLHLATHDTLTSLPNRALLYDRMEQAINSTAKTGLGVGLILLDIDHFKHVNDSLGHTAGDELLKIISKRLSMFVRDSDTVSRLGGDEFVLLLPRLREEDLLMKVKALVKLFTKPISIHGHMLTISASIGISMYPKDGDDGETLLKNADCALYQSKSLGRNTYQFYTSEFNQYLLTREELITDLHRAIVEEQFVVYYQPVIHLSTNKTTGLEALLRWNHPERGLLFPCDFIDAIEECGLMPRVGEWVLKKACTQAKIWHDTINPSFSMAINISPSQFKEERFLDTVQTILAETGVKPTMLEFEVTENLILDNTSDIITRMHELKAMGIQLSMDDFGTGYASLSYLKFFPFDKIKIDKSFIQGVTQSRIDRSIVEAILIIASRIGITVIAEGVSNEEELAFLQQHAATEGQGYYFSPAIDEAACAHFLRTK